MVPSAMKLPAVVVGIVVSAIIEFLGAMRAKLPGESTISKNVVY